jgi:hypothetical protein
MPTGAGETLAQDLVLENVNNVYVYDVTFVAALERGGGYEVRLVRVEPEPGMLVTPGRIRVLSRPPALRAAAPGRPHRAALLPPPPRAEDSTHLLRRD